MNFMPMVVSHCFQGNCPLNFVVKKTSDVLENTRQLIKEPIASDRWI